jgi:hypothetical protein
LINIHLPRPGENDPQRLVKSFGLATVLRRLLDRLKLIDLNPANCSDLREKFPVSELSPFFGPTFMRKTGPDLGPRSEGDKLELQMVQKSGGRAPSINSEIFYLWRV